MCIFCEDNDPNSLGGFGKRSKCPKMDAMAIAIQATMQRAAERDRGEEEEEEEEGEEEEKEVEGERERGEDKNDSNFKEAKVADKEEDQTDLPSAYMHPREREGASEREDVQGPGGKEEEAFFAALASGKFQNVVVCLGAGVSVAAGIPDFRSPGGLFEAVRNRFGDRFPELIASPEQLLSRQFCNQHRRRRKMSTGCSGTTRSNERFSEEGEATHEDTTNGCHASIEEWEDGDGIWDDEVVPMLREWKLHEARPTLTHRFLGWLFAQGWLRRVYTQNVDGLELSGEVLREAVRLPQPGASEKNHSSFVAAAEASSAAEAAYRACIVQAHGSIRDASIVLYGDDLPTRFFDCCRLDFPTMKKNVRRATKDDVRIDREESFSCEDGHLDDSDSDSDEGEGGGKVGISAATNTEWEGTFTGVDLVLVMGTSLQVAPFCAVPNLAPKTAYRVLVDPTLSALCNPWTCATARLAGRNVPLRSFWKEVEVTAGERADDEEAMRAKRWPNQLLSRSRSDDFIGRFFHHVASSRSTGGAAKKEAAVLKEGAPLSLLEMPKSDERLMHKSQFQAEHSSEMRVCEGRIVNVVSKGKLHKCRVLEVRGDHQTFKVERIVDEKVVEVPRSRIRPCEPWENEKDKCS